MTDNWGIYFADMDGHTASVSFDDGIAEAINSATQPNSLKLRIEIQNTSEDGMPTSKEGSRLAAFDEMIEQSIIDGRGLYLGRVTSNGVRWVLGLVPGNSSQLQANLRKIANIASYKIDIYVEPDPEKQVYWFNLYPSADSRQVMKDISVVNVLFEQGDQHDVERPVDHWTYFSKQSSASEFAGWLANEGYDSVEIEQIDGEFPSQRKWLVRSNHTGTMVLTDITSHTLKHAQKARELEGEYDGWETRVRVPSQ